MTARKDLSIINAAHGCSPCAAMRFRTVAFMRGTQLPRAFTLIELILVAAVLSIVAGIAAPRYASSLANYRLDSAARRVQTDIAAARAAARAQSASVTLQFGVNTYQITPFVGPGGEDPYRINLRSNPFKLTSFEHDFSGDSFLRFSGYGVPSRGGVITLSLGTAQRKITVHPHTGDTTVE